MSTITVLAKLCWRNCVGETVLAKLMGRTKLAFSDWQLQLEFDILSLRDLLVQVVQSEVAHFADRQQQRRLLQTLSPAQISLGLEQEKSRLGGSDLHQLVEIEQAIETALEGFTDGFFCVGAIGSRLRSWCSWPNIRCYFRC